MKIKRPNLKVKHLFLITIIGIWVYESIVYIPIFLRIKDIDVINIDELIGGTLFFLDIFIGLILVLFALTSDWFEELMEEDV